MRKTFVSLNAEHILMHTALSTVCVCVWGIMHLRTAELVSLKLQAISRQEEPSRYSLHAHTAALAASLCQLNLKWIAQKPIYHACAHACTHTDTRSVHTQTVTGQVSFFFLCATEMAFLQECTSTPWGEMSSTNWFFLPRNDDPVTERQRVTKWVHLLQDSFYIFAF